MISGAGAESDEDKRLPVCRTARSQNEKQNLLRSFAQNVKRLSLTNVQKSEQAEGDFDDDAYGDGDPVAHRRLEFPRAHGFCSLFVEPQA